MANRPREYCFNRLFHGFERPIPGRLKEDLTEYYADPISPITTKTDPDSDSIEQQVKTIRTALGRIRTIKTKLTKLGPGTPLFFATLLIASSSWAQRCSSIVHYSDGNAAGIASKRWLEVDGDNPGQRLHVT